GRARSDAFLACADFAGASFAGPNLSGARLLEARNLSQPQTDEAPGDQSPVLPPHLTRPPAWTGNVSPVSDYKTRSEFHALGLNGVDTPKRVETVSWLVGGPRSNRGSAEETAPSPTDSTA